MAASAAAAAAFLPSTAAPKAFFLRISHSTPLVFLHPLPTPPRLRTQPRLPLRPCSAVQDVAAAAVDEEEAKEAVTDAVSVDETENKRKLFVVNLPWSYSASDIEKLFGECGTVKKVEIIKQKNGKSRGFAFVVMATGEEAQAVVEKFNSYELLGRNIRVEFSKSFRKPSPPGPPRVIEVETRHKIYVSNLAWKVRSINLREFFSSKFNPVSARVIFDDRKSAGYGFVSFATAEEADAAFSELDGKDLMGRPLRLKMNQNKEESVSEPEEADISKAHSEVI